MENKNEFEKFQLLQKKLKDQSVKKNYVRMNFKLLLIRF
jgi:hypothetical protein